MGSWLSDIRVGYIGKVEHLDIQESHIKKRIGDNVLTLRGPSELLRVSSFNSFPEKPDNRINNTRTFKNEQTRNFYFDNPVRSSFNFLQTNNDED